MNSLKEFAAAEYLLDLAGDDLATALILVEQKVDAHMGSSDDTFEMWVGAGERLLRIAKMYNDTPRSEWN